MCKNENCRKHHEKCFLRRLWYVHYKSRKITLKHVIITYMIISRTVRGTGLVFTFKKRLTSTLHFHQNSKLNFFFESFGTTEVYTSVSSQLFIVDFSYFSTRRTFRSKSFADNSSNNVIDKN